MNSILEQTSVHQHEGAVVITCQIRQGCTLNFDGLTHELCRLSSGLEARGAIIGHIKAFAKDGEKWASFSQTSADVAPTVQGESEMIISSPEDSQIVFILFGITSEEALEIIESATIL